MKLSLGHYSQQAAPPGYQGAPRGARIDGWPPPSAVAIAPGTRPVDAPILASRTPTIRLGWLPALSLTSALGILLLAFAYTGARMTPLGGPAPWWPDPLFWCALLTLLTPIAVRLIATGASRLERVALVGMLGEGLYLVKVLRSPLAFELHDEFLHYRTVDDILRSGRLFGYNPLLPISALFPGLETLTSALASISGLSIFAAGIIVGAVARLTLVLALYLVYERVSASTRAAGIATLLYMINPKLLFFDAQFSYESLALPFAVLVLLALVYRAHAQPDDGERLGLTLVALLGLGALVITHHLTSYAFVLLLVLWTVVYYTLSLRRRRVGGGNVRERVSPAGMALLGLVLSLSWAVYVAPIVVGYLLPHLQAGVHHWCLD